MLTNICKNIPKEAGNIQYAKFHYFRPTVLGAGTFWFSGFCILSRRSGVGGDTRDTKSGQITIITRSLLQYVMSPHVEWNTPPRHAEYLVFYVSFHFTTFDNLFPRGRPRDSTWQAAGNNTNHQQPRNNMLLQQHATWHQPTHLSLLWKELGH